MTDIPTPAPNVDLAICLSGLELIRDHTNELSLGAISAMAERAIVYLQRTPSPALREAAKMGADALRFIVDGHRGDPAAEQRIQKWEAHAALLESLAEGV